MKCPLQRTAITVALTIVFSLAVADDKPKLGHSKHGSAFDSGLRSRPWKMTGIGNSPFPIETKNREMQEWYDQGNALLHSFWFEEAERTFRWCHKLEPENAMVYFGLARCGLNWFTIGAGDIPQLKRFREFLRKAGKGKHALTEREKLYVEAWEAGFSMTGDDARKVMVQKLQALSVRYPNDIEVKSQLAFYNIGQGSALANEMLIQDILRSNAMHPGAHHASIHNWDGVSSEQAIASCEMYGKAAPGIGHSLHMPGHIYSKVGMWHEAAIAMDSATRVELRYMNDRMALPFETWNYSHNRDYLCYIQEQLGRGEASIQGALDIINSPSDPQSPGDTGYVNAWPLMRALVKFERWDQILDGKTMPESKDEGVQMVQKASKVMALAAKGKGREAREQLDDFKAGVTKMMEAEIAKSPDKADQVRKQMEEGMPAIARVAEAQVLLVEGNRLDAIRILLGAAEVERKNRADGKYANDPPMDAWPVMRLVADAFARGGDHNAAIDAYEAALKQEPNDGWCLAGLAKSWVALGNRDKARPFANRLLGVWDGADADLRWMKEVLALNLNAKPTSETLKPERAYDPRALDAIGPSNWRPFPAPKLECRDADGKSVNLDEYRGKNVLLVFYLSDQCAHCVEQLTAINGKMSEFEKSNTVVLACSNVEPEKNKESAALKEFKIRLLSDKDHECARRYASYDDFENIELHSTILIDAEGRVRWKRTGGDPFSDVDFLLKEIARWPTVTAK